MKISHPSDMRYSVLKHTRVISPHGMKACHAAFPVGDTSSWMPVSLSPTRYQSLVAIAALSTFTLDPAARGPPLSLNHPNRPHARNLCRQTSLVDDLDNLIHVLISFELFLG